MQKVRKAVIPAAGLGTRFLPATKAMPKEMLPIVDTPTIQYIIEEALQSGIREFVIITNSSKKAIENHFSVDAMFEKRLIETGKSDLAYKIHKIATMAKITYVVQKDQKGLGHAILCAKDVIGDEPFAILLGDDLVYNNGDKPAIKQLMDAYQETNASVLGVQKVPADETYKYGIVAPVKEINPRLFEIGHLIEKPEVDQAPSQYAVLGRYVLSEKIFDALEQTPEGKNGQIQLTDAISILLKNEKVFAYEYEGIRYDVGDHFGFLKANIEYGLRRPDIKDQILDYLNKIQK